MKFHTAAAAVLASLALCAVAPAMSKKPKITVRFHTEANPRDSGTFAMPVRLAYAQRDVVLKRVPEFSERQVKAIYPFPAGDGTWGCTFQLDEQGRIRLETMSDEQRGSALVVYVGTKAGQHQVVDMIVDRTVSSGMITVPRGLTEMEVAFLRKQFPVIGEEKKKQKPAKKKDEEPFAGTINRERDARENQPARPQPGPSQPAPDLPRLAD